MKKTQPEETSEFLEPRVLPLPLRIKILTGTEMQVVFLLIALLSYCVLESQICSDHMRSLVLQHYPTRSVTGRLLLNRSNDAVFTTRQHGYRYTMYRHIFEYAVNGRAFHGVGYSPSRVQSSWDVTVYYSPRFAACSQIAGMRTTWDEAGMLFFGYGIAVTLLTAIIMFPTRIRIIRTLRTGQLTTAWISGHLDKYRKNQRRVRYEFRFQAADGRYYTTGFFDRYNKALEDESGEPLVYNPERPRIAFVLDSIPGRPRIDGMGVVRDSRPWTTPFLMIIPVAAIVMFGLCVKSIVELLV